MNSIVPSHDWRHIHEQLVKLSERRARLDYDEAQWLVAGERARVHKRLGHGSFVEYLGVLFGYAPRDARERVAVARRLAELPQMSEALRDGELVWSAARELGRVVTPDTEKTWLGATRDKSVRQIEQMVSGLEPGDLPGEPKKQEAERHVLRFEVDGATYATWREAEKKVRAEHGEQLSEQQTLLAIARAVLEGPKDEGRASYQVAITLCEECGRGSQDGRGEPIAVSDDVVQMALCDSQHIGSIDPTHVGRETERATQTIPPGKRRMVVRRDHGQCVVDGCRSATYVDVHHLHWRIDGGKHDIDKMCVMCGAHHESAHDGTLNILGKPSTGLSFFHADGTPYGSRRVDAEKADRNAARFLELKAAGLHAQQAWHAVLQP